MGVNANFGTFSFNAGPVVDFILYVALIATLATFLISYNHELKNVSADGKRVSERKELIAKIEAVHLLMNDFRQLVLKEPEHGSAMTPRERNFCNKLITVADQLGRLDFLAQESAFRKVLVQASLLKSEREELIGFKRLIQDNKPYGQRKGQREHERCLEEIQAIELRIKRALRTQRAALNSDMSELSHRMDQDSFGLIPDRGIARIRWRTDLWLPITTALVAFSLFFECVRNQLAFIVRAFEA